MGKFFTYLLTVCYVPGTVVEIENITVNNTATVLEPHGSSSLDVSRRAIALEETLLDNDIRPKTSTGEMRKIGAHMNPDLIDEKEPAI